MSLPMEIVRLARAVGPVAALALAALITWAWDDGGTDAGSWGLVGLGLVLLLAVAIFAYPPRSLGGPAAERRLRVLLVGSLAGFVAWNFASILWADFREDALFGSDKTLLYAVLFTLFALWRWQANATLAILGVFALGVGAVGAVVLVQFWTSSDPESFFQAGRLLPPTGYVNSNVALWMLAFWPAAYLSATTSVPAALRALFTGCATLLLGLSVLGESRSWFFLLPIAVPLFVLLGRQRLRVVLALALPTTATIAILDPLLTVYDRADAGLAIAAPADRAARLIVLASLATAAAGLAWTLLDRVVHVPRRVHLGVGWLLAAGCVAVLALGGVRTLDAVGNDPGRWLEVHWSDFTRGYPVDTGGSRFTGSIGTDRYLQWKVALIEFRDHPIVGIGSDNYAAGYVLRRQTDYVDPRYPHSTPLRLLSQLGLIGTLLFILFAGAALRLALRRRRVLDPIAGGAVAVCVFGFLYWLLVSSVDFFWEIPAIAAPAFALLGLAVGTALPDEAPPPPSDAGADDGRAREPEPAAAASTRGLSRAGAGALVPAAVVLATLAALLAVGTPWLSYKYRVAGVAVWATEPDVAYDRLARAAAIDRLTAEPYILEGSIALIRRELPRAQRAFELAREREPKNWYVYFQLAGVAATQGEYTRAAAYLRSARALNPADTILVQAAGIVRRRERLDPDALNALYLKELNRRLSGNPRL